MSLLNSWKDKLSGYVDVRLNLFKLSFIERTSTVLGFIILTFVLLFLSLAVLVFVGLGLKEWFSDMLNSPVAGAFLTALFFVVLMVVILLTRKGIVNAFGGIFVRILTDPGDDDEDDKHEKAPGRKIKVEGEDE